MLAGMSVKGAGGSVVVPPPPPGVQSRGSVYDGLGRGMVSYYDPGEDVFYLGIDVGGLWRLDASGRCVSHSAGLGFSPSGVNPHYHKPGGFGSNATVSTRATVQVLVTGGPTVGGIYVRTRTAGQAAAGSWDDTRWVCISRNYFTDMTGATKLREIGTRKVVVTASGRAFVACRQTSGGACGVVTFDALAATPSVSAVVPFSSDRGVAAMAYSETTDTLYMCAEYGPTPSRDRVFGSSGQTGIYALRHAVLGTPAEVQLSGGTGQPAGTLRNPRDVQLLNYGGSDNLFIVFDADETNATITAGHKVVWKVAAGDPSGGGWSASTPTWTYLCSGGAILDVRSNWVAICGRRTAGNKTVLYVANYSGGNMAAMNAGVDRYQHSADSKDSHGAHSVWEDYVVSITRCLDADAGTPVWDKITGAANVDWAIVGTSPTESWAEQTCGEFNVEASAPGMTVAPMNSIAIDASGTRVLVAGKSGAWMATNPEAAAATGVRWNPAVDELGAIGASVIYLDDSEAPPFLAHSDVDQEWAVYGDGFGKGTQPTMFGSNETRGTGAADAHGFVVFKNALYVATEDGAITKYTAYKGKTWSASPPIRSSFGSVPTRCLGVYAFTNSAGTDVWLAVGGNGIYVRTGAAWPAAAAVATGATNQNMKVDWARSGDSILVWVNGCGFFVGSNVGKANESWAAYTSNAAWKTTSTIPDKWSGLGQDLATPTTVYFVIDSSKPGIRKWTSWPTSPPPTSADSTLSNLVGSTATVLAECTVNKVTGVLHVIAPAYEDAHPLPRIWDISSPGSSPSVVERTDQAFREYASLNVQDLQAVGDLVLVSTEGGAVCGWW